MRLNPFNGIESRSCSRATQNRAQHTPNPFNGIESTYLPRADAVAQPCGIHSMELKARSQPTLSREVLHMESIQWNWKSTFLHVYLFKPRYTESIQWNWKTGTAPLAGMSVTITWESIQWNWKAGFGTMSGVYGAQRNPFNGIERAEFTKWYASERREHESIQWNWKVLVHQLMMAC